MKHLWLIYQQQNKIQTEVSLKESNVWRLYEENKKCWFCFVFWIEVWCSPTMSEFSVELQSRYIALYKAYISILRQVRMSEDSKVNVRLFFISKRYMYVVENLNFKRVTLEKRVTSLNKCESFPCFYKILWVLETANSKSPSICRRDASTRMNKSVTSRMLARRCWKECYFRWDWSEKFV